MARVLVIDDEVAAREAVQKMLESAGHEVVVAGGGWEGLKKYRINPPDLVLVDLFMPELDGIETILLLRKESTDVKIIAMSGNALGNTMLPVALLLGSVARLEKPFTLEQLLTTIDKVL